MRANKDYHCIVCNTAIAKGDDYDRLWTGENGQPVCQACIAKGYLNAPRDFLMWVGTEYYETIEAFTEEARKLGCCKRIPVYPQGIVPGKSRVFLIHENGADGPVVFGFFPVTELKLVVEDLSKADEIRKQIEGWQMKPTLVQAGLEEERGCGYLVVGGIYLYSTPDTTKIVEFAKPLADRVEVCGGLIIFKTPLPYNGKRFRGAAYLEPGTIPGFDQLGIKVIPWRQWTDFKETTTIQLAR